MNNPQINNVNNNLNSMDVDINKATPMMRQFLELKYKYQDVILLYRMGDFYETFFEDAITIARDLEITLTSRDAGGLGKVPMAGVPAKAVDGYIQKLMEKNHKVAICEQLEDASSAKGLVKRDVVKTLTAGTVTEDNLLSQTSNNYLAAVVKDKKSDLYGLAYTDITTGEFKLTQADFDQLISELARIKPAEIVCPAVEQPVLPFQIVPEPKIDLPDFIVENYNCSKMSYSVFDEKRAKSLLEKVFKVQSLEVFGYPENKVGFVCAGAIIEYLMKTQKDNLPKFNKLENYSLCEFVSLDSNTRKNLEILETLKDKNKFGSLLWAIDKTTTNMGARQLKKWLSQPLKDISKICARQSATQQLIDMPSVRLGLLNLLSKSYDIERLAMKLANNSANARDFLAIKQTLVLLPHFEQLLSELNIDEGLEYSSYLNNLSFDSFELVEFAGIIEKTIVEDAPLGLKDGNLIKQGVSGELDYFKDLLTGGEKWLVEFEEKEKNSSGIKNLRVGFSRTFGYFIEISNSNLNAVPQNYIRRQTLTNGERFITDELKKHENDTLSAQSKSIELEYKIFCELREYSKEFVDKIKNVAQIIANIDVLLSFAICSIENNYTKPEITDSNELYIKDGRHCVLEKILPMGKYVSNDLTLIGGNEGYQQTESKLLQAIELNRSLPCRFMILTGPNMAGKSTFMRQNALIVILAQIGCFVPATHARIGIVDKIFTRVGAVDDLSLGQSTFMVEMSETAYILNCATEKSLILLDEIGRGTSTYDGVAIAWSVSDFIATKIKARTIFSTHYHELNVMPNSFPQIKNYRITITENDGEIEFLRKVVEGSASKSYGIQVAKMAGLPKIVISKAQDLMHKMQKDFSKDLSKKSQNNKDLDVPQLSLLDI